MVFRMGSGFAHYPTIRNYPIDQLFSYWKWWLFHGQLWFPEATVDGKSLQHRCTYPGLASATAVPGALPQGFTGVSAGSSRHYMWKGPFMLALKGGKWHDIQLFKSQTSTCAHGCDVWLNDQAYVTRTTLIEPVFTPTFNCYLGMSWNWPPSETTKWWSSLVPKPSQISIDSHVWDTSDSTFGHLLAQVSLLAESPAGLAPGNFLSVAVLLAAV